MIFRVGSALFVLFAFACITEADFRLQTQCMRQAFYLGWRLRQIYRQSKAGSLPRVRVRQWLLEPNHEALCDARAKANVLKVLKLKLLRFMIMIYGIANIFLQFMETQTVPLQQMTQNRSQNEPDHVPSENKQISRAVADDWNNVSHGELFIAPSISVVCFLGLGFFFTSDWKLETPLSTLWTLPNCILTISHWQLVGLWASDV